MRVQLIGFRTGLNLNLVCWFCKERYRGRCSLKGHPSSKITDKSGPRRLLDAAFKIVAKTWSQRNVVILQNYHLWAPRTSDSLLEIYLLCHCLEGVCPT